MSAAADAPSAAASLTASSISAGYGAVAVIHDINLNLVAGEVVALLGPNGAGKSTTLRTLAGGLTPMEGTVTIDGSPTKAPLHRRARLGLAYIPEERAIFKRMSCRANLRVGRSDIIEALRIFPELEQRLEVAGGMLSGGEQQMVALSRALSRRPRVILADELSLGLAPLIVEKLLLALRAAADNGAAVLIVEQHVRQVLAFADRAHVMRRGRIELSDSASNMLNRMDELEQTYLHASTEDAVENQAG
jgi:ABC-type branched-subunit amino acid transport system ATPase component